MRLEREGSGRKAREINSHGREMTRSITKGWMFEERKNRKQEIGRKLECVEDVKEKGVSC